MSIKGLATDLANNKQKRSPDDALLQKTIHLDDVKRLWRVYMNRLKEMQGNQTLYLAMKKRDLSPLSSTQFEFIVDNTSQLSSIQPEKVALLDFLRQELKNYDFSINIRVDEPTRNVVLEKVVSGKERFALMARKFPDLNTMKEKLGLDIEY